MQRREQRRAAVLLARFFRRNGYVRRQAVVRFLDLVDVQDDEEGDEASPAAARLAAAADRGHDERPWAFW